jgi:hypothetical protein
VCGFFLNSSRLLENFRKIEYAMPCNASYARLFLEVGLTHFNFKDPFLCDSIFSPSIIPFQKPFLKSLRKFS